MSVTCCPLEPGRGNGPSCSSTVKRRARKEHSCCECREAIPVGVTYEYTSGIWDGEPGDFKTCLSCVEIRTHFACGQGYMVGQLWSDLHENFIPDMRAGGPCMEGLSPAAKQRLFDTRMEWLETDDGRDWLAENAARPQGAVT